MRADILDAALTALVKDALAGPAAWTGPGAIGRRSDDIVVAMLRALSGEGEGKLAPGTRQPPLIADVEQRLAAFGLTPDRKPKQVSIDWREPADRPLAHTLHQVCLLGLPGVARRGGPSHADARDLRETFDVVKHPGWLGATIEAARWGGELPMAAAARLNAHVQEHAGEMDVLAAALSEGLFAGLFDAGRGLVADLASRVSACHDVGALGRAGRRISRIYRYGDVFGADVARDLAPVCEAIFARALWLCECVGNDDEALRAIDAVLAVRDFARDRTDGDGLALDLRAASAVFSRLVASSATPPALAGAALGYLIVMGEEHAGSPVVGSRVRGIGTPQKLGDFLGGLFAVAREAMQDAGEALGAVDDLIADWTDEQFLTALPAMRGAFAWFPPRERERLARFILQRAGFDLANAEAHAVDWMRQREPIDDQAAALALETRVAHRLARYGLN